MKKRYSVAILALMGAVSLAEGATSNTVVLNHGGFSYRLDNMANPATRTSIFGGNGSGGITNFGPVDYIDLGEQFMGYHSWWYRGTGDVREYGLSNQVSFVQNSASSATVVYSEPSANGSVADALRFSFTYSLVDVGVDNALMVVDWTVTNTSNVTQNMSLLSFADLWPGGFIGAASSTWDYHSLPNRSQFQVWYDAAPSTEPFMTFGTNGAPTDQNDRWGTEASGGGVFSFPSSRMFDGDIDDAPNLNSLSIGRTNNLNGFGGALQWSESLDVGGSFSGQTYIGYHTLPAPGAATLLGFGGVLAARRRRR